MVVTLLNSLLEADDVETDVLTESSLCHVYIINYIPLIRQFWGPCCKSIYVPCAKCVGHKSMGEKMRIYNRGAEKTRLISCLLYGVLLWGTANKCRTSDKTVIWQALKNESFYRLTKTKAHYKGFESEIKIQMHHVEKVYSVKTKSTLTLAKTCCSFMWH